ncbi:Receptor-like protein kinase HSL1 [Fagus crenata]
MFPFLFLFFLTLIPPFTHSLNQDGLFLQQFKQSLSDPIQSLSSWNDRDDTPCNWTGIKCDPVTRRVNSVDLSNFQLAGPFPTILCRLPSLSFLSLFHNFINSSLPVDISTCQDLKLLNLSQNLLMGPIPDILSRIPNLRVLDLSGNNFSGEIPESFGEFRKLETLSLRNNFLDGSIPISLGNISSLKQLLLAFNPLSPTQIPNELGNLTSLEVLWLSGCNLRGPIPENLGRLTRLKILDLSWNTLTGSIPRSITELISIVQIDMLGNALSGELPSGMSKLTRLLRFDVSMNELTGTIPAELCGLQLVSLNLFENRFEGSLPEEIGSLSNLVKFSGDHNKLTGPIPKSFAQLSKLRKLDLSHNELFGKIPVGIKAWKKLNELNLANNRLYGEIPSEIGSLLVLNYLDLSGNHFSGKIPLELQNLKLNLLNLSNNRLSGDLPPLYANENYRNSFVGNPGLCGHLPDLCPSIGGSKKQGKLWILLLIFIFASIVLIVGVVWFYFKYQTFKKNKKGLAMSKWRSFHKLCFSEYEIVGCLNEDNVIGSGASGKVYKVVLSNGEMVAVKKLWGRTNEGDDSVDSEKDRFEAEVETMGKIRHKNIVKLLCCYDTPDCKLLVYEYMPKGSLGDLLHSSKKDMLDWPTRYRIALDAADGLSYLHHDCVPSIVHRDVKSNNILLDAEFRARVADFGVAKVVAAISKDGESMSVIAGSCGYIAPEYAYTLRVNEKSDIYSFGVIILELITGKSPNDPEFGERGLVKWVWMKLTENGIDHVIDPILDSKYKQEISKVLDIGLLCTNDLPITRPSMRKVVKLLREAGAENKSNTAMEDGNFSPYYNGETSDKGGRV